MPMDREQLALLSRAASSLSDAGAKVEEAHPNIDFGEQTDLFNHLIVAAISPSLDKELADVSSGSHLTWLEKDEQRARLRSAWADWFRTYDALLCPVLPVPAFPHQQAGDFLTRTIAVNGDEHPYLLLTNWTGLIGVVGLPSAVAPIGRTPGGVPVGVQVVTPYLRDREAVMLAGLLADAGDGGYHVPPGF